MKWQIGDQFTTAQGEKRWRVTDIGTRVIVAIQLGHDDDPSWCSGPPYALAETVFDEYDQDEMERATCANTPTPYPTR